MLNLRRQSLKRKIFNDTFYRFQSLEEVAIASELGIKIEVNQATVDEWLRLPGISIHQARNLVELIGMGMQFLSIEDLAAALSVSIQRLKPLEKILSFAYYDPESLLTPQRFNINTAQLDELRNIPMLDISLAEKILGDRQEKGSFQNLADFKRRLNLGSELTSELMHYLQF